MPMPPAPAITETEPTPLLRDFNAFVEYLGTHHVVLAPTSEFISRKDLFEMNREMADPITDNTPRTDQKFYPLLHLFYHLVLAGKLFQKVLAKGSRLALKETERLGLFKELNLVEKYFFLLETFWVDTDWEKLQGGYFGHTPYNIVRNAFEYLGKLKLGKKIMLTGRGINDLGLLLQGWEYFLLYFSYFGFWKMKRYVDRNPSSYSPKSLFLAESITPLLLGVTIAPILSETRNLHNWNLARRRKWGDWKGAPGSPLPDDELHERFDELLYNRGQEQEQPGEENREPSGEYNKMDTGEAGEPFFLPFVPLFRKGELKKTIPREEVQFIDGTYIFKVALSGSIWRRIAMSAGHTLLELHDAIQEAFEFDNDHLYSFFMDGEKWSHEKFTSPYDEEGPYVDDVRIGESGLHVGQRILYLFDYGDEWHFQVTLEKIQEEEPVPSRPKIIEKKGKPPEQYGY